MRAVVAGDHATLANRIAVAGSAGPRILLRTAAVGVDDRRVHLAGTTAA